MTIVQIIVLCLNLITIGFVVATLFVISDMNDGIASKIKRMFKWN